MANVNKPFGLRPVRNSNGGAWTGEARVYCILGADTSDYWVGSPVKAGLSADPKGIPTCALYVTGGAGATAFLGAIVGILPVGVEPSSLVGVALNLEQTTLLGSGTVDRYVLVTDDQDLIYEVQADATGLSRDDVWLNVELTVTAGTAGLGWSGAVITAPAVTATLPLRLIGFSRKANNEINAVAATDEPHVLCLVRPNEHTFKVGTLAA